jgi:hypothetical protein
LLALASLALPGVAHAQVNAEAIRSELAKDSMTAAVDASLVTRAGNTEGTTFGGGVSGAIVKRRHLAFARVQADYANAIGETTVSRAFAHVRYNYTLIEQLAMEAYGQLQSDRFRRLGLREVAGVGPRWEILHDNEIEIFAATSFMFENELLLAYSDPVTGVRIDGRHQDLYYRSSSYVGINYVIDAKSQITAVAYFQPRFDRPQDFRILHEGAAILGITKLLAVKLSVTYRYDSEPPVAVKSSDIEVKNSLMLRF